TMTRALRSQPLSRCLSNKTSPWPQSSAVEKIGKARQIRSAVGVARSRARIETLTAGIVTRREVGSARAARSRRSRFAGGLELLRRYSVGIGRVSPNRGERARHLTTDGRFKQVCRARVAFRVDDGQASFAEHIRSRSGSEPARDAG